MKHLLIASIRKDAGKTSIITALAGISGKKCSYIKPLGDRLIYRRKKNWDHDADMINNLWKLNKDSDFFTLGFNHSKMRYVYNEETIKQALAEMVKNAGLGQEIVFIEGCANLPYGSSINLNSLSVARHLDAEMIVVVSGENDAVMDDLTYLKRHVQTGGIKIKGVILNKLHDVDDFEHSYQKELSDLGFKILGMLPHKASLNHYTVQYLADKLFAKVVAGEKGLGNIVKTIFVGAMSTGETMHNPVMNREAKLLITSGDRSDMILAALDSDTVAIVLTNNLLPPSNILAKASEKSVPVLVLTHDTFMVAKQIDDMEILLTKDSQDKLDLLNQLGKKYLKTDDILK